MDEKSGGRCRDKRSEIYANKDQPRKTFDEKNNELTLSIKQHGVCSRLFCGKNQMDTRSWQVRDGGGQQ